MPSSRCCFYRALLADRRAMKTLPLTNFLSDSKGVQISTDSVSECLSHANARASRVCSNNLVFDDIIIFRASSRKLNWKWSSEFLRFTFVETNPREEKFCLRNTNQTWIYQIERNLYVIWVLFIGNNWGLVPLSSSIWLVTRTTSRWFYHQAAHFSS